MNNTQNDFGLFHTDDGQSVQQSLVIDDGSGLRVVNVSFLGEQKFDWDLFAGYDRLRVLTYSVSTKAIVELLDRYDYKQFECVFGAEMLIKDFQDVIRFQQVACSDTRAAIMGLKDERHVRLLDRVRNGQASFRYVREYVAHAKLYLLSSEDESRTRILVGSANLSEVAFSGKQPETLQMFENDNAAWLFYNEMYNKIRDDSSDEMSIPEEKIVRTQIEIADMPAMTGDRGLDGVLFINSPPPEQELPGIQKEKIEKIYLPPNLSSVLPAKRNGKQEILPKIRSEVIKLMTAKSPEEVDTTNLHIDRVNRTTALSGEPFSLKYDSKRVKTDVKLLMNYFQNYEHFEGDDGNIQSIRQLQRDYFTFWAWIYFSPFICDMRAYAQAHGTDVIRYPMFSVIYEKSACGKSKLIKTLMISMFGYDKQIEKSGFTTTKLKGLRESYKRFPVFFDDIGSKPFKDHGVNMIKDENVLPYPEYPCFIVSMNAEPAVFPDEVVRRSMMIYTSTALPTYNEALRQELDEGIERIHRDLTGHLYRKYMLEIMNCLDHEIPDDWLALSSSVLSSIIRENTEGDVPEWCRELTWFEYANRRFDRIKIALANVLRPIAYSQEGEKAQGWTIEEDTIRVWEQQDAFGRRSFKWDDVPSTLIDHNASQGGVIVLNKPTVEKFLGHRITPPGWRNHRLIRIFTKG